MKHLLIDTDVLLDVFFNREPFVQDSAEILKLCERNVISGYVTPVIISNVYYMLRKSGSHAKVIDQLRKLLHITYVLHMQKSTVLGALDSKFTDFEDALQHFAAVENTNVSTIVTRNLKDYAKGNLTVLSPEMYLNARQTNG